MNKINTASRIALTSSAMIFLISQRMQQDGLASRSAESKTLAIVWKTVGTMPLTT